MNQRIDIHAGSWVIPTLVFITLGGALSIMLIDAPLIALPAKAEAWATVTLALVVQAVPFLVLGVLLSGALSAFMPGWVFQQIPRGGLGVPVAALSGMVLPACECASIPVGQSLMRRGLSKAQALAFLLAAPAINPVVLVATYVAFNSTPMMVVARFAASLLAACVIGWLWLRSRATLSDCDHNHGHGWEGFRVAAMRDLIHAGGFLVLGAGVASVLKVFVSINYAGVDLWTTIAAMALLAIVMSLCSEADAFVAASFVGVSPIAQLVFMVVGPMIDLKLIFMHAGVFGWRFVVKFAPAVLITAALSAVSVGYLLF